MRGFDPAQHADPKLVRRIDRSSVLAIAASKQAVQDAQLDLERQPPGSVGIVLGTGIGGAHLLVENQQVLDERGPRRVSPFLITNMLPDTASGLVSIALGAGGPNFAVTAACATGGAAVGEAAELIRRGAADVIIAGGFEAPLKPIYYSGFQAMRALAVHDDPTQASRPFDADRNGFVISEGASVLILEELDHALARGARIYAEWEGAATASDAFDMAAAADDGRGIVRAMRWVLDGSGVATDEVDYLNAPRDEHPAQRPRRDAGDPHRVRRGRGPHRGLLDEVDAGAHDGRGRARWRQRWRCSPVIGRSHRLQSTIVRRTRSATSTTCRTRRGRWRCDTR